MPYKSLPLGAFWTIFGRNFPTGVPELLYPYQPANPLVESMFKALKQILFKNNNNNNKNRAMLEEEIPTSFSELSATLRSCFSVSTENDESWYGQAPQIIRL